MHPFLNTAIEAARKAGNHIVRATDKRSNIAISEKGKHDFVTSVDTRAEEILISILNEAYPKHNFITEERGEITFGDYDNTWIIDPLDGTLNFIHGYPNYCISMAFRKDGRIEHGITYNPLTHDLFTASRGGGAQHNGKRIRVSKQLKLDDALLSIGVPRDPEYLPQYLASIENLHGRIAGVRKTGSTALDLAYVAAGMLDGFWNTDQKLWDLAAGTLMIKEAGGLVTDYQGSEAYFETQNVVAANPKLIRQILPLLK